MIRDFPQRFDLAHEPGALLKRLDGIAKVRKLQQDSDVAHLAMIRECPCIRCGLDPAGEAAHVRIQSAAYGKRGGIGKKPADRWTISLCGQCHRTDSDSLHNTVEVAFWHHVAINPLRVCVQLYTQRGDLVAMRAVIFRAISERTT